MLTVGINRYMTVPLWRCDIDIRAQIPIQIQMTAGRNRIGAENDHLRRNAVDDAFIQLCVVMRILKAIPHK